MSTGTITMSVLRRTTYRAVPGAVMFQAMVRVYVKTKEGRRKDLAAPFYLEAVSPERLEQEVEKIKRQFEQLAKERPEFVEKIGQTETIEIHAPDK